MLEQKKLKKLFPNYRKDLGQYLGDILAGNYKPMEKSIKESLIRQFEGV